MSQMSIEDEVLLENEEELNDSLKKIAQKINAQNDFELKKKEFQETIVKSNKIILVTTFFTLSFDLI